jgi:hypothetical protein
MTYYVYENWVAEGHKARVHFGSCPYCKEGKGIHPNAGKRNGRWLGPYNTFEAALAAAHQTGGKVSACRHCEPKELLREQMGSGGS